MSIRYIDRVIPVISLFASLAGAISAFGQLAIKVTPREFAIAVVAVVAAAVAGALSVYISRVVNALSKKQRIFISYSPDLFDRAQTLRKLLEDQGAKVWLDDCNTYSNINFEANTKSAIESSNTFVKFNSDGFSESFEKEKMIAINNHLPSFFISNDGGIIKINTIDDAGFHHINTDGSLEEVAKTVIISR